jgi:hypothetical protein
MEDRPFSWMSRHKESPEAFFRPIKPEEYARLGIDTQDVPLGTFAAQDHPSFLPSRFGGNAYGLGLIEQSVLSRADMDFLDHVDFQDAQAMGRHARRVNAIYQKLGLLIRVTPGGQRYYLIPMSLVAHSLQDITSKADEIEEVINEHVRHSGRERLDIGLLTAASDLMVHELTARLASHRLFIFQTLDQIRTWRTPLDVVILPKGPLEFLLELPLPRRQVTRELRPRRLLRYAAHLVDRIYDLLDKNGKFVWLTNVHCPSSERAHAVRFKSEGELKRFLLFTHTFKTQRQYGPQADPMEIHEADLCQYMNGFPLSEPYSRRLLGSRKVEDLSVAEVAALPHLNDRPPQPYLKNSETLLQEIMEIYFTTATFLRKAPAGYQRYWQERLETDGSLPENLLVYVGEPRLLALTLPALEEKVRNSGMMGCTRPLVAEYRNSFRFLLDVLRNLIRIQKGDFPKIAELERHRLSNPFQSRRSLQVGFGNILQLMKQLSQIERFCDALDPERTEGQRVPVLENIPKLALHGFTPAQLEEILLIVVGHTTMSRIVFGKMPEKTLKPITDRAQRENYREVVELLRLCRLMSMAELAASLGESFTREQAQELFQLYDRAIRVATDPALTWERLHDLSISAMGGVQNRAIREIMKFFNLFEFLDHWQEFRHKGPFQREVLCDHDPDKLAHLEACLALARTAEAFQRVFPGGGASRQSSFYRRFLESEFHGTGHLFPSLGPEAGFRLLWITVNTAERHILNFNPLLARIPPERCDQRIQKIRQVLLEIPLERFKPEVLSDISQALGENRPAFVFDSGLRLTHNPESRAMDVAFVDIEENIHQIETLLAHLESQKLRGMSLRNLQDMESLFAELESFQEYLRQEAGSRPPRGASPSTVDRVVRDLRIERIESRLRKILLSQIFIPEEVHDALGVLAGHCPEILRFILPELHTLGNLVEVWPTRPKQSIGAYLMRCLQKFQALIARNRQAFQDSTRLYSMAKGEFGALAEESIGVSLAQLETLENLVDRVQQRSILYQAFTLALLFQDIGKTETTAHHWGIASPFLTHAECGGALLEKWGALEKYHPNPKVREIVIQLVRHHGLIGHVIQREEPVTALAHVTDPQDDRLLDAFVLHAVLATAAIEEGLLTADLLDQFLLHRARAIELIKSKNSWGDWLRENLRDKGEAVLMDGTQHTGLEFLDFPAEMSRRCGFADGDMTEPALWRGRQIAALERLLGLLDISWVDIQDLQMHGLKMPTAFIYHKKKLKSVGLSSFQKQLEEGAKLLALLSETNAEVCHYLLYCLDPLGGAMRIYDFAPLARFLEIDESLKLLLAAMQSFHHRYGRQVTGGLINFSSLRRAVANRQNDLRSLLGSHLTTDPCMGAPPLMEITGQSGGIHFQASPDEPALLVTFKDPVALDSMIEYLQHLWTHEALDKHFQDMTRELHKLPHFAEDYERRLRKACAKQQGRINEHLLERIREQLTRVEDFSQLQKFQEELQSTGGAARFTEEQQATLKELLEERVRQLRDRYLDAIYRKINACASREALADYWREIKGELFVLRNSVGKEYESLIAEFIDQKMLLELGE